MRFEYFVTKKIVRNDGKSFSRLIVTVARIAIALSLCIMIISSSMVKGFRDTISDKIYGFWGHINISKESLRNSYDDEPIARNETFINDVEAIPGVMNVQVYARKAGIIKTKTDLEGIILKGVGEDFNWQHFNKYIVAGSALTLNDSMPDNGILLSKSTAERLKFSVGDSAILYFIDQTVNGDYEQRYKKLKICGIYNTGLEEFDKLFAITDIRYIQKLNDWNKEQVGGYEVYINEDNDINEVSEKVNAVADPFWDVQTIQQIIPSIFDWLNLQKINERIILVLMIIVAGINMITSLLILILERTNMIGILKSMGSSNWSIRKIFLLNASYIIFWGMLWGNIVGIGMCLIQQYTGIIKLPEQSYYVSVAPVAMDAVWIIGLNIGTLLICLLFLIIPSYLISRIQPIKAIRFN